MVEETKSALGWVVRQFGFRNVVLMVVSQLIVLSSIMQTTPVAAVNNLLVRWDVIGQGVLANIEAYTSAHSQDLRTLAVVLIVGSLLGIGLVGYADSHLHNAQPGGVKNNYAGKAHAPATLAFGCLLLDQSGGHGGWSYLAAALIGGMGFSLASEYQRSKGRPRLSRFYESIGFQFTTLIGAVLAPALLILVGAFLWYPKTEENSATT
ncbi:hypothetical protein [Rhodococcus sp. 1139]|uniref:hypothetical protein n=1 Tax=Rhodococcus sp. 1139 TaxID=1833762 RepID=UPI000872F073|nr:hypothetical protein [Rhodococcus sp. 1139]OFE08006.1 hypothetical protein A5N83_14865 [Rhodococcus sp. 1139]